MSAVAGREDVVPVRSENRLEQAPVLGYVVHHEDAGRVGAHGFAPQCSATVATSVAMSTGFGT